MSKYKFHSIISNRKIIKRVKNDLQGTILLTKKNKYKNLYSKLYDKRKRRFLRYFKKRRILNFLVIANRKLLYVRKFNRYYFKKFTKFHKIFYHLLKKKKNLNFKENKKKLPYFFYLFKLQKKMTKFVLFKKYKKALNIKLKKKFFSNKKRNNIITKKTVNFFFKLLEKKKIAKKKFKFKNLKKIIRIKKINKVRYFFNQTKYYKSSIFLKKKKLIKKIIFKNFIKKKQKSQKKITKTYRLRIKFKKKFRLTFEKKKKNRKKNKKVFILTKMRKVNSAKLKKLSKHLNLFNWKFKKKKHKLNDLKYLLKNQFNNFDFYILRAKYGSYVPKFYKELMAKRRQKLRGRNPKRNRSIFDIKAITLFKKRKKLNNFGRGLRQKEVLRRFLGNCSNKQLKNFFFHFKKYKNLKKNKLNKNFIVNFFYNLESTLLFFLIRSKFFLMQINYLKSFIEKNGVLVNNKIIIDPYFKLKIGDKINFNLELYPFIKYHFLKNFSTYSKSLSHILISYSTLSFYYIKLPKLKELDFGFKFNPNLFRQLYKKNKYFNNIKLI